MEFIRQTLVQRLRTGAVSLLGKVGQVASPHLVLPLTVEPTKPRLCHDARFLNLWMKEKPFTLDRLTDLPRYVFKDSYQTVIDDKSGYDHILLTGKSYIFWYTMGRVVFHLQYLAIRVETFTLYLSHHRVDGVKFFPLLGCALFPLH